MNVIYEKESQRVPIKLWTELNDIEVSALNQLKNIANMPFVFKHVAAMPDVHYGIGATVGSVIATKGAVIPAAVGVDIGCGMMAVEIDANLAMAKDKAQQIRHSIERSIPLGFGFNRAISSEINNWPRWKDFKGLHAIKMGRRTEGQLLEIATTQLCSLGGGNHFIELCEDADGGFWVMLHSGSRGIGNQLARVHMHEAKGAMKRLFIDLPDPDLAYFAEGTPEYGAYMDDLAWAQDYAAANREFMMKKVLKDISHALGLAGEPIPIKMQVNCHHNYASRENHYGENVVVTRKGAIRARQGDLGIIPGSMGTRSYIVEGLGSYESFNSCSHGAGRRMSRTAAKKTFTNADLVAQTAGVECKKDDSVLDEIPGAYKDIDQVMENQKDLVRVVAQLKQFICVKG